MPTTKPTLLLLPRPAAAAAAALQYHGLVMVVLK
jgi:hypothetical protein